MNDLDPAVARMIDATNREDTDAFLAAFAADAVVDDWGTEFAGRERIARWNHTDNIGKHSRFAVTGVSTAGDRSTVSVTVSRDGFNGPARSSSTSVTV
jgi:hypothetical protein